MTTDVIILLSVEHKEDGLRFDSLEIDIHRYKRTFGEIANPSGPFINS